MDEYPIIETVKEKVNAKGKSLGWLFGELDKGKSWFYSIKSINDLQLKTINQLSELLDFDFIQDLYKWNGKKLVKESAVSEPTVNYKPEPPMITVQISIQGTDKRFENSFGDVLKAIKKEGEKSGFKIA